jgi:hypothetical protein
MCFGGIIFSRGKRGAKVGVFPFEKYLLLKLTELERSDPDKKTFDRKILVVHNGEDGIISVGER